MRIGATSSSPYYPTATTTLSSQKTTGNSFASEMSNASGTTGTSGSYDFTNMSQEQMQTAMKDLVKSGKMTFDEVSLAVPLVQSPLSKVNYDGQWPDTYTKPTNFISTLSAGIEAANSRGDSEEAKHFTQLMNALERVQATQKG